MEKTLRELAEYLQGTLENEDQKLIVTGVNGLVEAGPQDISLLCRLMWNTVISVKLG